MSVAGKDLLYMYMRIVSAESVCALAKNRNIKIILLSAPAEYFGDEEVDEAPRERPRRQSWRGC